MARELPKPGSPRTDARPSHEEISRRAYEIYVERGRPEGRDMEHWLEAETQIASARQSSSRPASATKTDRSSIRRQPGERS